MEVLEMQNESLAIAKKRKLDEKEIFHFPSIRASVAVISIKWNFYLMLISRPEPSTLHPHAIGPCHWAITLRLCLPVQPFT